MMSEIIKNIEFNANAVSVNSEKFTDDYSVIGIYFSDAQGQENWNFTKALCNEEIQKVCTVKEIQQIVLEGGIEMFRLERCKINCIFFDKVISKTQGIKSVVINFNLGDNSFLELRDMAVKIFENNNCFSFDG